MIIWNNNADEDNQGFITSFLGVSMDNVYSVSLTQAQGQALSDAIYKDQNQQRLRSQKHLMRHSQRKATSWQALAQRDQ